MKAGLAERDLGALLKKQKAEGWDIIIPSTAKLTFDAQVGADGKITPTVRFPYNGDGEVVATMNHHAFRQMASWAEIPAKYVERLSSPAHAALLKENVQHWLDDLKSKRMLRFFKSGDGAVLLRAWLSDRYRRFDNWDLAQMLMPLIRANGWEVKSSQITERRLYLQIIDPELHRIMIQKTPRGNVERRCFAGVVISNSEVGDGSLLIEPMIFDSWCTNGNIYGKSLRRNHVGRAQGGSDDEIQDLLSDETKALDDAAFWAKAHDVTVAAFDVARFEAAMRAMQNANEITVPNLNPEQIVDVTASRLGLNDEERDAAFMHLFDGGDLTLYGISAAVTRTAEDVESYDRAVELERSGFDVLSWKPDDLVREAERIAASARKA